MDLPVAQLYYKRKDRIMEDFNTLWDAIEAAIEAHPVFNRYHNWPPTFHVSRDGVTVSMRVTVPRKKTPLEIRESAETAKEATDKLINNLGAWAKAFGVI